MTILIYLCLWFDLFNGYFCVLQSIDTGIGKLNTNPLAPSMTYLTRPLAPYACDPWLSRGRLYREEESETRSAFQRDRDRIIHSGAFRRLKHKTQVFVYHEGDYYRTRLTHSLEVAQIARSMSRYLGVDEDLSEAIALAHDLGHTPFGHAGEDVLAECMANYCGFDHNAQSLRVVTELEKRYAEFDGLNLTWEALEGIVKHNGPVTKDVTGALARFSETFDLELKTYASVEAQVAALSDDIAYNNHDLDDGLRAGLFDIPDLADVPLAGEAFHDVMKLYPDIDRTRLIHEAIRRLIARMVNDAIATTQSGVQEFDIQSPSAVRQLGRSLVRFSDEMTLKNNGLQKFLHENMYRHYQVNRMRSKVKRVVEELFDLYMAEPDILPEDWHLPAGVRNDRQTANTVCDYIAGMTDRFALEEHRRLFQIDLVAT